jgi:hypothetical protein
MTNKELAELLNNFGIEMAESVPTTRGGDIDMAGFRGHPLTVALVKKLKAHKIDSGYLYSHGFNVAGMLLGYSLEN